MLYRARFAALAFALMAAPCAAQLATGVNYNANTPAARYRDPRRCRRGSVGRRGRDQR